MKGVGFEVSIIYGGLSLSIVFERSISVGSCSIYNINFLSKNKFFY